MIFTIGDKVVHPQHGVGQIVKLEDKEFESGVIRQYYEISMLGGSTVWAPVDLSTVGLRKPAKRSDIAQCRRILTSASAPLPEDLRTRQSSLLARLKQGTIVTFCEVVRDLYAYGEHKSLYGTIAGFFRVTQDVLAQEWSLVEGVTLLDAMEEINSLLAKGREAMNAKKR